MDVFLGVETQPLYPRNIPDEAIFELIARGSAVNSSDHVIIYENTGKFGFFLGARAWWLFKVKGYHSLFNCNNDNSNIIIIIDNNNNNYYYIIITIIIIIIILIIGSCVLLYT